MYSPSANLGKKGGGMQLLLVPSFLPPFSPMSSSFPALTISTVPRARDVSFPRSVIQFLQWGGGFFAHHFILAFWYRECWGLHIYLYTYLCNYLTRYSIHAYFPLCPSSSVIVVVVVVVGAVILTPESLSFPSLLFLFPLSVFRTYFPLPASASHFQFPWYTTNLDLMYQTPSYISHQVHCITLHQITLHFTSHHITSRYPP